MQAALCAYPRLRAHAVRDRHRDRQVLPAYLEGRTEGKAAGAPGRPAEALEIRPAGPGGTQIVDRLPGFLYRAAVRDRYRPGALVRGPGRLENPSQPGGRLGAEGSLSGHEAGLPDAASGIRGAQ